MTRRKILLSLFDPTGFGLEIGPSYNPLLPKKDGYNIEILDHLNADDLVNKYQNAKGVDTSNIEHVDYVSTGVSIFDAIGAEQRFDYIVASHVIEHTVDFIGFINDCGKLLKPEGVLVLAIPDKRFCFDVLRPVSSTGDILQSHIDRRARHNPGALFDEIAYNSLRKGALAWPASCDDDLEFCCKLEDAKAIFETARQDDVFRDIHAWQFTPSSFRLIINDLYLMGYILLHESRFVHGEGEFFVVLSQAGAGPQLTRITLAQQVIAEQNSILLNKLVAHKKN